FSLAISGVRATTTGTDGDLTHVVYTQGTATVTQNGQSKSASVNNGCYAADGSQQCVSQWPDYLQNAAKAFGIDKGIPVTLKQVNGGYQLDPVGTFVGLATSAMNHADQLATAYGEFMSAMMQQLQQFNSQYGGSSSGTSSSSCYDSSGNYIC
ncbi:MAG TPA: hypothetical protein VN108_02355, partial [Marmoricola sp.]|nr:hypothetical protein [Marmoricola sp.]